MNHRPSALAIVALILGLLATGPFLFRSSNAQPLPAAESQPTGRFRASIGGGSNPWIVVIDTTTGQCWTRNAAAPIPWKDLGSPAEKK